MMDDLVPLTIVGVPVTTPIRERLRKASLPGGSSRLTTVPSSGGEANPPQHGNTEQKNQGEGNPEQLLALLVTGLDSCGLGFHDTLGDRLGVWVLPLNPCHGVLLEG